MHIENPEYAGSSLEPQLLNCNRNIVAAKSNVFGYSNKIEDWIIRRHSPGNGKVSTTANGYPDLPLG